MKDYQIRGFTESDSEVVEGLLNARLKTIAPFDKLDRHVVHPKYAEKELEGYRKGIKDGKIAIYLATLKDKVVGEIIGEIHDGWVKKPVLWRKKQIEGEIADLFVLPGHRGKGVAQRLIKRLEEWFKQKGCKTVIVGTEVSNSAARKCYKQAGFVENGITLGKKVV